MHTPPPAIPNPTPSLLQPKLIPRLREALRFRRYSLKTEKNYVPPIANRSRPISVSWLNCEHPHPINGMLEINKRGHGLRHAPLYWN